VAWRDHSRLAVIVGVLFRRIFVMLSGVQVVAMSDLGVVRRLVVLAGLVMLCGFAVVFCCLLVMFCSLLVVSVNFVISHALYSRFCLVRLKLAAIDEPFATLAYTPR
jgi:hypothetical protein